MKPTIILLTVSIFAGTVAILLMPQAFAPPVPRPITNVVAKDFVCISEAAPNTCTQTVTSDIDFMANVCASTLGGEGVLKIDRNPPVPPGSVAAHSDVDSRANCITVGGNPSDVLTIFIAPIAQTSIVETIMVTTRNGATASNLDNLNAPITSRASTVDVNSQDRFMTMNIPAGASAIPLTAVTLQKIDGYTGYATIVAVVTNNQAGKSFTLQADTNGDGTPDTDVAAVTFGTKGTKIAQANIPSGTDRLFIISTGNTAAFGANVAIQFDSIIP